MFIENLHKRFKLILFLIFFIIYAFLTQSFTNSAIPIARFFLVKSIFDTGSPRLDYLKDIPYYKPEYNWVDCVKIGEHWYSNKEIGTIFTAGPTYLLTKLSKLDKIAPFDYGRPYLQEWAVTVFSSGIFGALAVVLMYSLCSLFVDRKSALATAIIYGLGTQALPYSTVFYNHQIVAFFSLATFYLIFKYKNDTNNVFNVFLAGVCSAILFLSHYSAIITVAFLSVYVFLKFKFSKKLFLYILPIISAGICLILFNYLITGDVFKGPMQYYLLQHYSTNKILFDIKNFYPNFVGNTVSFMTGGIFAYSPILFLSIPGFFYMFKSFKKEALIFFGIIVGWILFFSFLGPTPIARQLISIVQFIIIPIAFLIEKEFRSKFLNIIFISLIGWMIFRVFFSPVAKGYIILFWIVMLPLFFIVIFNPLKFNQIILIFFIVSCFNMTIWVLTTIFINPPYYISYGLKRIMDGYVVNFLTFWRYAIGSRNDFPWVYEGRIGMQILVFLYLLVLLNFIQFDSKNYKRLIHENKVNSFEIILISKRIYSLL